MFFILFVWSLVALVIASAACQLGRSRIEWLILVLVPTMVCAGAGAKQERELKPYTRQTTTAQLTPPQQQWAPVSADNGAAFAIKLDTVGGPEKGIAAATMCQIDVDGHHCVGGDDAWVLNAKIFWFDCRGHFADVTHPAGSGWQVAPPYSVIGRASQIVCEKAGVDQTTKPHHESNIQPDAQVPTSVATPESSLGPVSLGNMPIDFVGDWCSPFRDKGSSMYTLPSWTDGGKCADILSIDKYGFYFNSEKIHCEPVNCQSACKFDPSYCLRK
ncbi:hypothetical protein [Bradyrhizobium sp. 2S1]|uniref:hypothetical protein n=1 Tax=Bradyrhizobium sp. 2S1 TaxID=1404429 RepID=UPI0014090A1E|nr:hypothetical protein [Bradyrhizobium sp. 2S1]MCK7670316.1 hypothetical protein [Bradyrhizobium sp. 2S1]